MKKKGFVTLWMSEGRKADASAASAQNTKRKYQTGMRMNQRGGAFRCVDLNKYSFLLILSNINFIFSESIEWQQQDDTVKDQDSKVKRLKEKHPNLQDFKIRVWAKMLVSHIQISRVSDMNVYDASY